MSVNNIQQPTYVRFFEDGEEKIINSNAIFSATKNNKDGKIRIEDNKYNEIACIDNTQITLDDFANKLGKVIDVTA